MFITQRSYYFIRNWFYSDFWNFCLIVVTIVIWKLFEIWAERKAKGFKWSNFYNLKTVMPFWGNLWSKIEIKCTDFCLILGVSNKYVKLCTNFSIILSSLFTGSVEKLFSISKHGSVGEVVWSTDNSIVPGIVRLLKNKNTSNFI